jgi:regulator of sigma E protease
MLSGIIAVGGLIVLIIIHELGHFLGAKSLGMRVDEFGIGFPPKIWGKQKGETEYSINWLPFGGFVRIAGEETRVLDGEAGMQTIAPEERKHLMCFRPAGERLLVILAGILVNIIAAWVLFTIVFSIGSAGGVFVGGIRAGSPAEQAGFKTGDLIQGYARARDFSLFTENHKGQTVTVQIERGTETLTLSPTIGTSDQGPLGVALSETGIPRLPIHQAALEGIKEVWRVAEGTVLAFTGLIQKLLFHFALEEGVVGPVGIFGVAQSAGKEGIIPLLYLLALISANLGVLNLIPFPALDGGRALLILIEKIKGSPVSHKIELAMNGVGFALLILLMVVVTVRDVRGLF